MDVQRSSILAVPKQTCSMKERSMVSKRDEPLIYLNGRIQSTACEWQDTLDKISWEMVLIHVMRPNKQINERNVIQKELKFTSTCMFLQLSSWCREMYFVVYSQKQTFLIRNVLIMNSFRSWWSVHCVERSIGNNIFECVIIFLWNVIFI